MDLDKLKQDWSKISLKIDKLEIENRELRRRIYASNAKTAQQSLARKYSSFALLGLTLPPLAVALWYIVHAPVWLCVVYAVFGVIQSIAYFVFASYIRRSDYISLPITEAISHAINVRRTQFRLLIASISLGLIVIIPLFHFFFQDNNPDLFISGCLGGLIGAAIGIRKDIEMFRLSRQMIKELNRFTNDEETDEQ